MLIHWTLAALLFMAARQDDAALARPSTVEFPLADYPIASAYSMGRRAEISALRLTAAPRDPETVRLLIELGRYDEALALLHEAVRSKPEARSNAGTKCGRS